jgi:hypothetical protein
MQVELPLKKENKHSFVIEQKERVSEEVSSGDLPLYQEVQYKVIPSPEGVTNQATALRRRVTVKAGRRGDSMGDQEKLKYKRKKTLSERMDYYIIRWIQFVGYVGDKMIPERFNPRSMEEVGETRLSRYLRMHFLDTGRIKRKVAAILIMVSLFMLFVFTINAMPWKVYFGTGVAPIYVDSHGRRVANVVTPHYLDPSDPSDRFRIDHVIKKHVFPPIKKQHLEQGFLPVPMEYNVKANISLPMLEEVLSSTAKEMGFPCICAAHVGVPLNVMYIEGSYIYDPKVASISTELYETPPIKSNIYYSPRPPIGSNDVEGGFVIRSPEVVSLRAISVDGYRTFRFEKNFAACVTFCAELALKRPMFVSEMGKTTLLL